MTKRRWWPIFIFGLVFSPSAHAQFTGFSSEQPSFGRQVRNLGMGNTGVALRGTADSAVYYNPASLNDLEKWRIQFMSITAELTTDIYSTVKDFQDLNDTLDAAQNDTERLDAFNSFLVKHSGEFQYGRMSLDLVNFSRKNFAIGAAIDERIELAFRDQWDSRFDIRNFGDIAMYAGVSHDFFDKLIQFGVTVRPTVRFSLNAADESVSVVDVLAEDNPNIENDGSLSDQVKVLKDPRFGLGVDLGLKSDLTKLTKLEMLRPQVGFTWTDMGSPTFGGAPGNPQSLNIGAAIHPDLWKLKNAVALDIRGLNQERDFISKLHFGVESVIDFPISVGLRAGLSQGYFTAGFTLDFTVFKLEGAWYGEEVGRLGHQDGSYRAAVRVAFAI